MRIIENPNEDLRWEVHLDGESHLLEFQYVDLGHGDFDVDVILTHEVMDWLKQVIDWRCRISGSLRVAFRSGAHVVSFASLSDAVHFKLRWS